MYFLLSVTAYTRFLSRHTSKIRPGRPETAIMLFNFDQQLLRSQPFNYLAANVSFLSTNVSDLSTKVDNLEKKFDSLDSKFNEMRVMFFISQVPVWLMLLMKK